MSGCDFRYTLGGSYTDLVDFTDMSGNYQGADPYYIVLIEVAVCPAPVILTTIPNQSVCQEMI